MTPGPVTVTNARYAAHVTDRGAVFISRDCGPAADVIGYRDSGPNRGPISVPHAARTEGESVTDKSDHSLVAR